MTEYDDYQRRIFTSHLARTGLFKGDIVAPMLLRLIGRYVSGPCLDIGAGSGRLLAELSARGLTAFGLDLCPSSRQIVCGTITSMPFGSGSFVTVFCCDIFEHLTDQQLEMAMPEITRVLIPGGSVIITTPFQEDLRANMILCPQCGHEFHRYGHWQSFTMSRLKGLVAAQGLRPIFGRVYALGAMAKLPLGRYLNWFFKRLEFESVERSIVFVAKKQG